MYSSFAAYVVDIEVKLLLERQEDRSKQLKECKTQEERDRLQDRWAVGDAAEKIASAVRRASLRSNSFFGLF